MTNDQIPTREQWFMLLPVATQNALHRGADIALAALENANAASRYWGLWESLNSRLEAGKPMRLALEWKAPTGLGPLRQALAESALMATLRVSDNPKSESTSLSICLLSGLLRNELVVDVLRNPQWFRRDDMPINHPTVLSESEKQPGRICWFLDRVPIEWGPRAFPPNCNDLLISRKDLKAFRDKAVAHSDSDLSAYPSVQQIQKALTFTRQIAETAGQIFLGREFRCNQTEVAGEMDDLWQFLELGLVSAHRDHKKP